MRWEPWLFLWRRNARFRRNIPDAELAEPPDSPVLEEQLPAHGMQEPQLDIPVQEIPRMEETVRPEQPALSPVTPQQPEGKFNNLLNPVFDWPKLEIIKIISRLNSDIRIMIGKK